MRLIDTHAHIHDREFAKDGAATLARARAAGVELVVTLGVNASNSARAIAFAEEHAGVVAAAGVHPHDATEATERDLDALEELARHERVAMVGEIGLDFYRNLSPHDVQIEVLRRQLATAQRAGKPVAVHAREAHGAMEPELARWSAEMGGRLPDGRPLGVLHYFAGDAELARRYIAMGFLISIHTSVTHPKAAALQQVAREVALDHLVVETDSPYGAPQRYRGKRNEPAYVAEAAQAIADLRRVPIEAVAEATTANALRLLGVTVSSGRSAA
jgi:TatD DNase family protein